MSDTLSMSPLERRYRRWTGLFPATYREEREDELVGVLLEAARPGRDRPQVAEVVDLARAAAVAHGRAARSASGGGAWGSAGTVVGIILVVLLAAQGARFVAVAGRSSLFADPWAESSFSWPELRGWYVPVAWTAVLAMLALGCTRLACAAAWLAVGTRLISLVELIQVPLHPWSVPGAGNGQAQVMVVQLTLGVIAAALLSRPRQVRTTIDAIGRRRLVVGVLAFALALGVWRWNDRWGSGFDVWVLVAPFAVVLACWAGHIPLRRLPLDAVARRIGAGLVAVLVVFLVSDVVTSAFGARGNVTRKDVVATFAVGLGAAVAAAVVLALAPVAARRLPFRVVRRR